MYFTGDVDGRGGELNVQPECCSGEKQHCRWKEDDEYYTVVWYGNTQLGEKRNYHSMRFVNLNEASEYYQTTAHGWPTGGKGDKSEEGVGNTRILFDRTMFGYLNIHEKEKGYQPPSNWLRKMRQLAS